MPSPCVLPTGAADWSPTKPWPYHGHPGEKHDQVVAASVCWYRRELPVSAMVSPTRPRSREPQDAKGGCLPEGLRRRLSSAERFSVRNVMKNLRRLLCKSLSNRWRLSSNSPSSLASRDRGLHLDPGHARRQAASRPRWLLQLTTNTVNVS